MTQDFNRRQFLQRSTAAAMTTLAAGSPRLWADDATVVHQPRGTADSCILLWMAGGMAAPETFDPKRYFPFEIGLEAKKIESTFPAIDTVVDDIKITKGLEHIAHVMDRASLVRSHYVADLGQYQSRHNRSSQG